VSFAAPMRVAKTISKHANSGAEFRASCLATRQGASIEKSRKVGLGGFGMLRTMAESDREMGADFQRRVRLGLILVLLIGGCSTADRDAANFKQSQKLRKNALAAARQGDTASALDDINRVQVLEPPVSRSPGLPPPQLNGPEHRTIAPASGDTTCSNIGINRFSCF
jgi:hypothetical protein